LRHTAPHHFATALPPAAQNKFLANDFPLASLPFHSNQSGGFNIVID
jgi:hypothetical protein